MDGQTVNVETIDGRKIVVTIHAGFYKWKLVWKGIAQDVETKISGTSGNRKSQGGAREHAVSDLFLKLKPTLEKEKAAREVTERAEKEAIAKVSEDLPPGWLAKYDHMKNRVFYVDTVFKKTQWEKPGGIETKSYVAEPEELIVVVPNEKTRYFISHKQSESAALALDIWRGLGGPSGAWLDVKNTRGQSVDDMKEGIRNCEYFLLILTKGYFDSDYCVLELKYAIELGKEAIMVFNTDKMAKNEIGAQLAKAKQKGVHLKDWPSAMQMSTDGNLFDNMLATILKTKPRKLVKSVVV